MTLLKDFLDEELKPIVRQRLQAAADDTSVALRKFHFNRFDIIMNHEESTVVIEDILDVQPSGTQRLALADFIRALIAAPDAR